MFIVVLGKIHGMKEQGNILTFKSQQGVNYENFIIRVKSSPVTMKRQRAACFA